MAQVTETRFTIDDLARVEGKAELVGGLARGEAGPVHQRDDGLAVDVRGDPVEAGGGEGFP